MNHNQPLTEQDLKMMDLILKEACQRESGFCPGCNSILAPERAVSVDLIVTVSGHTLYRNVVCAQCYDDDVKDIIEETSIPSEARWRIIDGRTIYLAQPQHQPSESAPKAGQAEAEG